MKETHEVPGPVPSISRRWLWITLAMPPVVTLLVNAMVGFHQNSNNYDGILWAPLAAFFAILWNLPFFHDAVAKRYRGRSLVFLNFAYFFGQIIICLSLWLGSCLLFVN